MTKELGKNNTNNLEVFTQSNDRQYFSQGIYKSKEVKW